jgi:hypothetical protein
LSDIQIRRERARVTAIDHRSGDRGVLLSVFKRWRAYYSRPYVCLFDSVCLLRFLNFYNLFPTLVFGVVAEPFHAHCWLQDGGTVLNDTVERVSAYSPIMSV